MARYGYGRVSTRGQAKDGNSLEDQNRQLMAAGCDSIVLEAYTGTKMSRPKFDELISRMEKGDTLVVCKLDRFARTAREGLEVVEALMERGISVHILNMGLIEDTAMGQVILTVMLAFAEFERNMIIERTTAGKAYKRDHDPNFKEGRPRKILKDYSEISEKNKKGFITVNEACKELGISRTQWYRLQKEKQTGLPSTKSTSQSDVQPHISGADTKIVSCAF